MSILARLYAEGGNEVILNTLEITCAAWEEPIVLVRDYVDHVITTENGRTLTAVASGMQVALPKRDASAAQKLTFAIDGVRSEATKLMRDAHNSGEIIQLTLRVYTSNDLTEPAETPITFSVDAIRIAGTRIDLTAALFDMIDMRWPREVFNSQTAPMIKYIQ